MKGRKKILAISGSTKKNSSNNAILEYISEAYKELLEVKIYDALDKLPHFNPDLDNGNLPSVITDLRNHIQAADGIIICTPEYVFSLPGSLKNAIEWNVSATVFSNKPVAIIVAAASGEKAFESLDLIMTTIESRIAKDSKLLIKGVKSKIGMNGEIKDQHTSDKIKTLVASLIHSIEEENQQPTKYSS